MAKRRIGHTPQKDSRWIKHFSKKELNLLFRLNRFHFSKVVGRNINWKEESYQDFINSTNPPIYFESDRNDDSEGVQPKQLKIIIEKLGIRKTIFLFEVIQKSHAVFLLTSEDEHYWGQEQHTGKTIYWKEIFNQFIVSPIKNKEDKYLDRLFFFMFENPQTSVVEDAFQQSIKKTSKSILHISNHRASLNEIQTLRYDDTVIDGSLNRFINNESLFSKLKRFEESKIHVTTGDISIDMIDVEKFFKGQKNKWKKVNHFIPRLDSMLLLNPEHFNRTTLFTLSKRLINKDFPSATIVQQEKVLDFYKKYGDYSIEIHKYLSTNGLTSPSKAPNLYGVKTNNKLLRILRTINQTIYLPLNILNFVDAAKALENESISNVFDSFDSAFRISDLTYLTGLSSILQDFSEIEAKKISKNFFRDMKKYNVPPSNVERVLRLYLKTCHIESSFKPVSGEMSGYTWRLLQKDEHLSLIAGDAVNCCQTVTGAGRTCVYYAAESKTSGIVAIFDKAGTLVSQSWIWLDEESEILVLDSIESVRHSATYLPIYKEFAEKMVNIDKRIKQVNVGQYRSESQVSTSFEVSDKIATSPETMAISKATLGNVSMYSDARRQYLLFK